MLQKKRNPPISRMKSIGRKFKKDPRVASKYKKIIKDYIGKWHATKLIPEELSNIKPFTNYNPHFSVSNVNKSNKIIAAFDAAAEYQNSSWNKHLWKGIKFLSKLRAILLRFGN